MAGRRGAYRRVLCCSAPELDLGALTGSDTRRGWRGLTAVVIALIADFVWHAIKAVIDRTIVLAQVLLFRTARRDVGGRGCALCCRSCATCCSSWSSPWPC